MSVPFVAITVVYASPYAYFAAFIWRSDNDLVEYGICKEFINNISMNKIQIILTFNPVCANTS